MKRPPQGSRPVNTTEAGVGAIVPLAQSGTQLLNWYVPRPRAIFFPHLDQLIDVTNPLMPKRNVRGLYCRPKANFA
jgi:hypothetical protein